ncbi:hypothetical protein LTR62_006882 [Meristemomyces frigidus]|uniref:Uncharacterized protein n=1 Tax=Meristemomyces frigidus TaxID=1508187 RepID=A0AAN7TG10_9PEZI|nr:hypothetical protein LTR62_006882 [Meristemomyces frigidus]
MHEVLADWCVPGGPCRSRLGKRLTSLFDAVLQRHGKSQAEIAAFRQQVIDMRSGPGKAKGGAGSEVVQRATKLTRQPEHKFRNSIRTTLETVWDNEICSPEEWNARYEAIQARASAIQEEEHEAQKALKQKMIK